MQRLKLKMNRLRVIQVRRTSLVTFETDDNYSMRFEISNNLAQLFDSIQNEKNTIRTALALRKKAETLRT